jgi:hypothetical protein
MTIYTGKIWEMGLAVTFHTEGSYVAADQQESIWRSMRVMASIAPFELLYAVFKDPGASLLRVTFIADVGVKFIHFSQTRSCSTPVGCMTVRASQRSLDDAMVVGKIKLGFNVPMAGEAEFGVFFLEQIFSDLSCMNLMAVITPNSTKLMDPSSKLEKCFLFLMALQTDVRTILCFFAFKREDEPFSFCLRMLCSGTMARFAFSYPMGIFLKKIVNVRMTLFTCLSPYITFLLRFHLLLAK